MSRFCTLFNFQRDAAFVMRDDQPLAQVDA
jgi:hypothetical protein